MATTKRKRTRRSFYKTGTHNSPKLQNKMEYRSGWEKTVAEYLDIDPNVVAYWYEAIEIPYKTKPTNHKTRKYIPDFIIEYKDGTVKMIEVKRDSQVHQKKVQLKAQAARHYCKQKGLVYEFWANEQVKNFTKILKEQAKGKEAEMIKKPTTKKKKSATKKQNLSTPTLIKNNGVKSGDVFIGLDISTQFTGYCVLDHNNGLVKLGVIKLTSTKLKDHYDKLTLVEQELTELFEELKSNGYNIKDVYVEEAHMRFSPGFSSAKTLFSLATFNGSVCWIAYKLLDIKAKKVGVRSVRSKLGIKTVKSNVDKKEQVFQQVKTMEPNFPWVQKVAKSGKNKGKLTYPKYNYDMADAYLVVRGGRLLNV